MKKLMLLALAGLMIAAPAMAADPVIKTEKVIAKPVVKKQRLKGAVKITAGILLTGVAGVGLFNLILPKYELAKWNKFGADVGKFTGKLVGAELGGNKAQINSAVDRAVDANIAKQEAAGSGSLRTRINGLTWLFAGITGAVVLIKSGVKDCRGK